MQPPLSYREVCSLPPAWPPSPLVFHLRTPKRHPNRERRLGEFPARASQPQCPPCQGRDRHKALAHGDIRQLPCCPHPQHHPAGPGRWRWHPKGGGGRRREGTTQPWALLLGTVPVGVGAPPKGGRYRENGWQLARGQAWEGGGPPAPRGREQSLGISFLAGPGCPPSALPVLLPRSGAGTQLNQCSANNLPANKTFSSLSLLPPTPPQSVCDGSALI